MTRPIDAIPLDASGRHVPADSCPCRPIQASDLLEPGRLVRVHRHIVAPRDPEPEPEGDGWFLSAAERHAADADRIARRSGFDR